MLQRIGELYAVEAEGKHLPTEARQQLRTEKSLPILQSLHDWLLQTRAKLPMVAAPPKPSITP